MRPDRDAAGFAFRMAALAIFVAPFIALLYRAVAGLVVMAIALGATSLLLHGALAEAEPRARRWFRALITFNILLAAASLIAAGWLIARG